MSARVVLLAQDCPATRIVYHWLRQRGQTPAVILEQAPRRSEIARRRLRRLGAPTVFGQMLFVSLIVPLLRRAGRVRIRQILDERGLSEAPIPDDASVTRVATVNAEEAREALRRSSPDIVVVSGTRIIRRETLRCVDAPFVNMHMGITPRYRGVHGGYWALAEGRPERAGTTVHLVDEGVDTGPVLVQVALTPTRADSFATYPYLHLATTLPHFGRVVDALLAGETPPVVANNGLESRMWSHPTILQYAAARIGRGVR